MDHPCYKCGHSVEDGKPFCLQCGAPQIRVMVPEPVPVAAGGVSSSELPIFPGDTASVPSTLASVFSTGIVWRRAFQSCAIAASIAIVAMSLRLTPPLVAMPGAGFLAVLLYRRRNPNWMVTARSGAQLGAVTGLLCAGVFGIFLAIFKAALYSGEQVRQVMIEALQQAASRYSDPQVQATLDLLVKPENVGKLILNVVGFALFSIAAGGIAGALTGSFLGSRNRP